MLRADMLPITGFEHWAADSWVCIISKTPHCLLHWQEGVNPMASELEQESGPTWSPPSRSPREASKLALRI